MATPQPIAGNQDFTNVANQAAYQDELNARELSSTNLVTSSATVQEGHILTQQNITPGVVVGGSPGLTGATMAAGSSDTAGRIIIAGQAIVGSSVTLKFTTPFPSGTRPSVVVSPVNAPAAVAHIVNAPDNTGFILSFQAVSGVGPEFNYIVIG